VRDATGAPVPDAVVYFRDADGRFLQPLSNCISSARGRYEFAGAPPGTLTAFARGAGACSRESAPVAVIAGSTVELDLELAPAGTLTVVVEDEQRQPTLARVRLIDARGSDWALLAIGEHILDAISFGTQSFGSLCPGQYEVHAYDEDGRSASEIVKIEGPGERVVRLSLKP
jgi:hypothetical protein